MKELVECEQRRRRPYHKLQESSDGTCHKKEKEKMVQMEIYIMVNFTVFLF
jgi:hypothetical protein